MSESQLIQANRLAITTGGQSLKLTVDVNQKLVLSKGAVVEVLVKQAQPVLILEGSGFLFQGQCQRSFQFGSTVVVKGD